MNNIAVIIRAYSRVDDVESLIQIIDRFWKIHNYTIYVSFNGTSSGHILSPYVYEKSKVIELKSNNGHINGASDLVIQGYNYVKNDGDYDYFIFIESDFWLLDEKLIISSIESNKDICSTIWIEKCRSLAVDFFMMKSTAISKNPNLLDWHGHSPEIALSSSDLSVYIQEDLRAIHPPSLMRKLFNGSFDSSFYQEGRFRLFPKAAVLTHHVETLPNGINSKRAIANTLLNQDFFTDVGRYKLSLFARYASRIAYYFPKSSWFNFIRDIKLKEPMKVKVKPTEFL